MDFSSIIKTDRDRLFQVDEECYIICTGDSTEDEHPFIRIGNWADMPRELIPLIKNVVITDSLTGNPGCEQLNIDAKNIDSICYIGSEDVVKPYIKFQKLFGIDLAQADVVDIKKDIPEISNEKNLSDDDQFIGVFYRDGSFKTVHNGKTILELKDSSEAREERPETASLFSDSGLFVQDGNPVFFHKGVFLSYMLPKGGFNLPKSLTKKFKAVIYPSADYLNLSTFLKQRSESDGQFTVFTDRGDDVRVIQKLFKKMQIKPEGFSGMRWVSPAGMMAEKYPDSPNIRLTFPDGFSMAFIKSAEGVQQVLKDKLDWVVIEYSAYLKSVLLFKSVLTPVAVINDTNESDASLASKLTRNTAFLKENKVYRFVKKADAAAKLANEDVNDVLSCTENELEKNLDAIKSQKDLFNSLSLLRMRINSLSSRDEFRNLLRIYNDFSHSGLEESGLTDILIYEGGAYMFSQPEGVPVFDTIGKIDIYIEKDRKRLEELLALFKKNHRSYAADINASRDSRTILGGNADSSGYAAAGSDEENSDRENRRKGGLLPFPSITRSTKSGAERDLSQGAVAAIGVGAFGAKIAAGHGSGDISVSKGTETGAYYSPNQKYTGTGTSKYSGGGGLTKTSAKTGVAYGSATTGGAAGGLLKAGLIGGAVAAHPLAAAIIAVATVATITAGIYKLSGGTSSYGKNANGGIDMARIIEKDSGSAAFGTGAGNVGELNGTGGVSGENSYAGGTSEGGGAGIAGSLFGTGATGANGAGGIGENYTTGGTANAAKSTGIGGAAGGETNTADSRAGTIQAGIGGANTAANTTNAGKEASVGNASNNADVTASAISGTKQGTADAAAAENAVPSSVVPSKEKIASYNAMPANFRSNITNNDIYRYVNLVAVKNGYRQLSEAEMRSKNPNRIFPKETFAMLDDQMITIVKGDTLWDLAKRKLIELDAVFYELMQQIENASGTEKTRLTAKAKGLAFTRNHHRILNSL